MSAPVIRARGVGKQFQLGNGGQHSSLREAMAAFLRAPLRRSRGVMPPFWALKDVSFDVNAGEVLGLIGRNGSGKSTLLKIMSRITEPTTGEIRVEGRVGSLLEVGTGFHPELTGRENIFLNGAILGMRRTEIASKFDEIVAFAETAQFLDTPVKFYSSGMYTRLAFAVAAHLEPEILLVDEVLAVGDVAFQRKCLGKMGAVASNGRTVIFVSHNLGAIGRLCATTLWLDAGQVAGYGPTAEVVGKYLASSAQEGSTCVWPEGLSNSDVDDFKLLSARILDHSGQPTSTLDLRYPFAIGLGYRCLRALPYCRVGFVLSTGDGTALFETYDSDDPAYGGRREPGEYDIRCEIPGHLLLPGRYFVSVNAGVPGVKNLVYAENVLSLVIEETDSVGDAWARPYGLIRPNVRWDVRRDSAPAA